MSISQYEIDYSGSLRNVPPKSMFFGLSTDDKPTTGVGNGSAYVEMDTSTMYFFDVDNSTWRAWNA